MIHKIKVTTVPSFYGDTHVTHLSPLTEEEIEALLKISHSGIYWFNKLLKRGKKAIMHWEV